MVFIRCFHSSFLHFFSYFFFYITFYISTNIFLYFPIRPVNHFFLFPQQPPIYIYSRRSFLISIFCFSYFFCFCFRFRFFSFFFVLVLLLSLYVPRRPSSQSPLLLLRRLDVCRMYYVSSFCFLWTYGCIILPSLLLFLLLLMLALLSCSCYYYGNSQRRTRIATS